MSGCGCDPNKLKPVFSLKSYEDNCDSGGGSVKLPLNTGVPDPCEGAKGKDGLSAYELWVLAGNVGSIQDFLDSLIGKDGDTSQTVLTEEVFSTLEVGNIKAGETLPEQMTFTAFAKKLLQKIFYPTFTLPTFSLSNNISGTREVGETVNVTLTFTFNRGQIKGNLVGGIWDENAIQNTRAGLAIEYTLNGSTQSGNIRTLTHQVILGANAFTGTVKYETGPQPKDSVGMDYDAPLAEGTSPIQTTSFSGSYRNFFGVGVLASNSSQIRGLSGNTFNNTFSIVIPAGQTKVSFAYPATRPDITDASVKYVEGFNSNVGNTFTKSTFMVNDAGGNPVSYKVYTVEFPAPEGAQVTYNVTLP